MTWQNQNKLLFFSFVFLAIVFINSGVSAMYHYASAQQNQSVSFTHNSHFDEASTVSFPDYINRYFEIVESKENKDEREVKDERIPQFTEVCYDNPLARSFLMSNGFFQVHTTDLDFPKLYILLKQLKIFF